MAALLEDELVGHDATLGATVAEQVPHLLPQHSPLIHTPRPLAAPPTSRSYPAASPY